jgi:hypothetical protein
VFNTPLDEAGILSLGMGNCYQGRIALPEIQFLDYMSPAYQQLKDRICTVHQRSKGEEPGNVDPMPVWWLQTEPGRFGIRSQSRYLLNIPGCMLSFSTLKMRSLV